MNDEDRLAIQMTQSDGVVVLALRGEIDIATAPCLRAAVRRASELGGPVVLNMALVTFMDSSGIAALIAASGVANGFPSSVQIREPSDQVRRILSLAGVDEVFMREP